MSTTRDLLDGFLNQRVIVLTNDGRVLLGSLSGFDPQCNLVLEKCVERIFSSDAGVEEQEHGLFVVRGDNVATIGEVDNSIDDPIDWNTVIANPLKDIKH